MLPNGLAGRQPGGGEPLAHPLSVVRAERGWTYQDLVDAVARRVGNMSARREKAWRWERRGVVPDRGTQEALADELGVSHDVVSALGWPAWLPVGDRGGITAPWTPDGCLTALNATAGSALLDRRGFLVSSEGSAAAAATQWLALAPCPARGSSAAGPPAADDDEPVAHNARPGVRAGGAPRTQAGEPGGTGTAEERVAEELEQRLPHLRAVERTLGGGRVRALADAELRMVVDLLLSRGPGTISATTARRLFAVAAELARLAGMASLDTGYQAAAERYLTAALSAAHAAGDRLLGANVLRCLSLLYLESGRRHDALALARAARQAVGADMPAPVAAMLAVQEAQAHAALGAAEDCDGLLAEAAAAMTGTAMAGKAIIGKAIQTSAPPSTPTGAPGGQVGGPGWASDFDEAEFRAQAAVCHLLLRRPALADVQLARALLLHPTERARDRAMYLVRHAEAALDAGDIERGHHLAEEAASWTAGVESLRIRRRLGALQQRLRRQRGTPLNA